MLVLFSGMVFHERFILDSLEIIPKSYTFLNL